MALIPQESCMKITSRTLCSAMCPSPLLKVFRIRSGFSELRDYHTVRGHPTYVTCKPRFQV